MNIIALLHTSEYRGDHTADACELHEIQPGETVANLCDRLFTKPTTNTYAPDMFHERIELRPVKEFKGFV